MKTLILDGLSPIYYYDSTVNNGDGTFGDWSTLFHQPALDAAGVNYNDVAAFKPTPSRGTEPLRASQPSGCTTTVPRWQRHPLEHRVGERRRQQPATLRTVDRTD